MRLGKNERAIILATEPGQWVPPSIYLGKIVNCPHGQSLNRLVDKGLVEIAYGTFTRDDLAVLVSFAKPGVEHSTWAAAIRLTEAGSKERKRLVTEERRRAVEFVAQQIKDGIAEAIKKAPDAPSVSAERVKQELYRLFEEWHQCKSSDHVDLTAAVDGDTINVTMTAKSPLGEDIIRRAHWATPVDSVRLT